MIYFESGVTGTYGSNAPRIGWNSATRRGTTTASTEATGFEAVNAAGPFEYSYWKATATTVQWISVAFDSTETINAVGISQHNLGTIGAELRVQIPDGVGGWTEIGVSVTPTDDSPIVILLADRDLDGFRVTFRNMTAEPQLAVFCPCEVLEFPVRTYVGQGAPSNMARRTEYMTSQSNAGKYLGRSIKKSRNWVDVPIAHFSEAWAEANFDAFAEDARSYPYFLMPRPADYPDDVQYKWSQSDLVPERMGVGGNLMQVTV